MEESSENTMSVRAMLSRFAIMIGVSLLVGFGGVCSGALEVHQAVASSVFIAIIFGTLFFWGFRLAVAFLGLAVLVFSRSLTIPQFVQSSSLEVILFLVGMMVIVGALRDLGFFTWVVQLIVAMPHLTARKFITVTAIASALLACAVDEVTSIIFISTLIFQVCNRLKISPAPFILIAVLCTNIGSSGTMMGNPVGIYIGNKGGLSFGDFMTWAFPLMFLSLLAAVCVTILFFRKALDEFDVKLKERLAQGLSLAPVIKVPYRAGLVLLILTTLAIASHHQTEGLLKLSNNSVLLITPLICAGIVMILKPNRARYYIEREVDWWTLLFFMLLFAVAGTLEHTGVDLVMARAFSKIGGTTTATLVPFIFTVSAIGSAFVDNVIFVAAFCPVIEQLSVSVKDMPLWWALLFGACFGGNITMIGSTANIVALGMLEKRSGTNITFFQWLKIGALVTVITGALTVAGLLALEPLMADRPAQIRFSHLDRATQRSFNGKLATLSGKIVREKDGSFRLQAPYGDGSILLQLTAECAAPESGKEYVVTGKVTSIEAPEAKYPVMIAVSSLAPVLTGAAER